MSRQKKPKFRLEDLDANEVSLVPKGAIGRSFSILKMDDSAGEHSSKSEEGSVTQNDNALFEQEILKADLEEALAQPVDGEEEIVSGLLEKEEGLSSRAVSALRGALRIFTNFREELPNNFMEMLNPVVGEVKKEENDMAEKVTKATQDEEALKAKADSEASDATDEDVIKAKKQEEEEEEEENGKKKKLPAFLRRKQEEKKKSATSKEDLSDDDAISNEYEDIRKENEDIRKENEEIKKLQEETRKELMAEKDARATEQAIKKAAKDYPNLPVKPEEIGPIVKKVTETLSKEEVETFERVLKAADDAIKARKDFEEAKSGSFAYGETGSPLARLKDVAKSIVEKSDKPITQAAAFAQAADQNPQLYDEYLAEQRG